MASLSLPVVEVHADLPTARVHQGFEAPELGLTQVFLLDATELGSQSLDSWSSILVQLCLHLEKRLFLLVLPQSIEARLHHIALRHPLRPQRTNSQPPQLFPSLDCDLQIFEHSTHSVMSPSFVLTGPYLPLEEDTLPELFTRELDCHAVHPDVEVLIEDDVLPLRNDLLLPVPPVFGEEVVHGFDCTVSGDHVVTPLVESELHPLAPQSVQMAPHSVKSHVPRESCLLLDHEVLETLCKLSRALDLGHVEPWQLLV